MIGSAATNTTTPISRSIVLAILVACGAFAHARVVAGRHKQREALAGEMTALQSKVGIGDVQPRLTELKDRTLAIRAALPQAVNPTAVLNALMQDLNDVGMSARSWSIESVRARGPVNEVAIQLEAWGSYPMVCALFERIRERTPIVRLEKLAIRRDGQAGLAIDMRLLTFANREVGHDSKGAQASR